MKKFNKKASLYLGISLIIIFVIALIVDKIGEFNREKNLYNIGNLQEVKDQVTLPAVAVFNEYVYENFNNIEINKDNTQVHRADSLVDGTSNSQALENAKQMQAVLQDTILSNTNIDGLEFELIKDGIFNNQINGVDLNYFKNINQNTLLSQYSLTYLQNYIDYKAVKLDESGYVVNYYDGYEGILNPNDSTLDWNFLANDQKNSINLIPGLKYVDNKTFYIYAYTKDISNLNKDSLYNTYISINDINHRATFEEISLIEQGYVIKFRLFDGIENILDNRFLDIKLDLSTNVGYTVPKSSVISKEGQDGLYYLKNNIITFTPIKIISENDEGYFVTNNFNEIFPKAISSEMNNFSELQPFTKIVINPEDFQEGDSY